MNDARYDLPLSRTVSEPPPPRVSEDSAAEMSEIPPRISQLPPRRSERPARLSDPAVVPRSLTPPDHPASVPPGKDIRRFLTPSEQIASPLPPRRESQAPPAVSAPPRMPSNAPATPRSPTRPPAQPPPLAASQPQSQRPRSAPTTLIRPSPKPMQQPVPWPTALRAPREDKRAPLEEIEHTPAAPKTTSSPSHRFMRGASMPPLVT